MKLSRRALLKACMGATQLGLLNSFGVLGRNAFAQGAGSDDAPSRLLTIYVPGGYHPLNLFCPLSAAEIAQHVPQPVGSVLGEHAWYTSDQVENLAPANGGYRPVRIARTWDAANPASRERVNGRKYMPMGYAWREYALHEQLALVHGVDQQTAAHNSGYIASMCGVAGPDYRAPAMQCVVANALYDRYPNRPLPCVAVDGRGVPNALGLPTRSAASVVPSITSLGPQLSDSPAANPWWTGLNDRLMRPGFHFQGQPASDVNLTALEAHTTETARLIRGASNAATDGWLEKLHDGLKDVGSLLARDVVSALQNTPGVEYLPEQCTYGGQVVTGYERFGYRFGLANGGVHRENDAHFEMALRLMKADLSSSIHLYMPAHNHDSHSATGHQTNFLWLRGEFDSIGRLLGEMKATPAPNRPGRSLLDDTLVLVFSEFSRTWPHEGDDHWPITSMLYAGGGIASNRSLGGFDTANLSGGPRGVAADVIEETQMRNTRPLKAADIAATTARIMGLRFEDFFIPGGFGEIAGVRRS